MLTEIQNCTITAMSTVAPGEVIEDGTVIFSNGTRRVDHREFDDHKKLAVVRQLVVLRKMIPSNPDKFK